MESRKAWSRRRLEADLAELNGLLRRARRESRGTADDRLAQQLLLTLVKRRRRQLRTAAD